MLQLENAELTEGTIVNAHTESLGYVKKLFRKDRDVTGGSTGIGLATAKRFVQEGMDHVFIKGRREDSLDAAVAEIGKNVTAVTGG